MNNEVIWGGEIYRIERRRKHPCAETRSRARQRHWNLTCIQKAELKTTQHNTRILFLISLFHSHHYLNPTIVNHQPHFPQQLLSLSHSLPYLYLFSICICIL
ncbi:hypothetical protein VNO80_21436 [Phaseolus coccineus]|uniref:Uncharacterized protein n=1 Tax=Phaseolus coccineus TaxID=3886 RepID=A0AAN9M7W5_PHACN